ncbi:MAG: helix-turn-helix domain-containing protein [Desulfobacteraceae bacterium]|jgi:excisionase family DNA binding protein
MERYLFSVEKVSELLGLHRKTVLRYIKEGRLKANKVGGRWRVHGNDLTSFVGFEEKTGTDGPRQQKPKADVTPEPWVSIVVNAENIDREESIRISNTLIAIKNSNIGLNSRCRIDTVYFEEELKIQILIWGTLDFCSQYLKILEKLLK